MKSIKTYSFILVFAFFCNYVNANNIANQYLHKAKSNRSFLNILKTKKISKYKYLAPIFPSELPIEENVTIYFKNIFNTSNLTKNENIEVVNVYSYLAPVSPLEIPIEEEITVYLSGEKKENIENDETINKYQYLAPDFLKVVSIDE